MKHCPYCTKRLPFWNLVWQRLTFSEEKSIVCPSCTSVISTQGYASIWPSLSCGIGCGGLLGMFLGEMSLTRFLLVIGVVILTSPIFIYISAPIRDS
jgi:uncharacterized membrane protein YoaK (UPF0700 family)